MWHFALWRAGADGASKFGVILSLCIIMFELLQPHQMSTSPKLFLLQRLFASHCLGSAITLAVQSCFYRLQDRSLERNDVIWRVHNPVGSMVPPCFTVEWALADPRKLMAVEQGAAGQGAGGVHMRGGVLRDLRMPFSRMVLNSPLTFTPTPLTCTPSPFSQVLQP